MLRFSAHVHFMIIIEHKQILLESYYMIHIHTDGDDYVAAANQLMMMIKCVWIWNLCIEIIKMHNAEL